MRRNGGGSRPRDPISDHSNAGGIECRSELVDMVLLDLPGRCLRQIGIGELRGAQAGNLAALADFLKKNGGAIVKNVPTELVSRHA